MLINDTFKVLIDSYKYREDKHKDLTVKYDYKSNEFAEKFEEFFRMERMNFVWDKPYWKMFTYGYSYAE